MQLLLLLRTYDIVNVDLGTMSNSPGFLTETRTPLLRDGKRGAIVESGMIHVLDVDAE